LAVLVVALLPPAALGAVSIPAAHPRVCIDRARLSALRERLKAEPGASALRRLEASAGGLARFLDPADPFPSRSPQSRRLGTTAGLSTLAFAALLGDEASAKALDAFFRVFTLEAYRKELDPKELMPRGEVLEGYALALDWAWDALSPEARARLTENVVTLATDIHSGFVKNRPWEATTEANNHSMAAAGPLGIAALALYHEHPEAKTWFALVEKKVNAWFEQAWDPDGASYEGPMYGEFGLMRCFGFTASLREYGGADHLKRRLPKIVDYYVASQLPGMREVNLLNDSGGSMTGTFTLYSALKFRDGKARWLWEEANLASRLSGKTHGLPYAILWGNSGVEPVAPAKSTWRFKGRGLVYVRTGFGEKDFVAHFEAGDRRKGCHCQGDQNHFTLYALGEKFACDTGYNNVAKEGTANQSIGHNLLLVDGKGQALSGGGKIVTGRLAFFKDTPEVTAAVGDATKAYGRDGYNTVVRAHRTFLFLKERTLPPYVILVDDLRKGGGTHDYEWILHTWPGNRLEAGTASAVVTGASRGGKMDVHFAWPPRLNVKADRIRFKQATIGEHPLLRASWKGAAGVSVVALVPRPEGTPPMTVKARASGNRLTVTFTRGDETDTLLFADAGAGRGFSPVSLKREGKGLKKVRLAVRAR
jgi:hypothetical protein